MLLREVYQRTDVDHSLPYDAHLSADSMERYQTAHTIEPWKGPHEGRYLILMLHGKKPAAMCHDYSQLQSFAPFIKKGVFSFFKLNTSDLGTRYCVTQKGEEWRAKKIETLYNNYDRYKNSGKTGLWHAKVGILLGYSNNEIRSFLNQFKH